MQLKQHSQNGTELDVIDLIDEMDPFLTEPPLSRGAVRKIGSLFSNDKTSSKAQEGCARVVRASSDMKRALGQASSPRYGAALNFKEKMFFNLNTPWS